MDLEKGITIAGHSNRPAPVATFCYAQKISASGEATNACLNTLTLNYTPMNALPSLAPVA